MKINLNLPLESFPGLLGLTKALIVNKCTNIPTPQHWCAIAMTLSSIRALLIDLSGTIHIENEVIPGAVEAVKKLRDAKVPLKFVTNTTKVSI